MENRERDRVSQRTTPTEAGQINRSVEEEKARQSSGTDLEFGQKIGQSEHLDEGGTMRNRQEDNSKRPSQGSMENESSRRNVSDESGYGSSSGRDSGSLGNTGSSDRSKRGGSLGESDIESDRSSRRDRDSNVGDSSSGRH